MLAKDPVGFAVRIRGDVVIAAHFLAIPPARLDALRTREEIEPALKRRIPPFCDQALWALKQPDRPGTDHLSRMAEQVVCPRFPISLGSMVVGERDTEHAIASEPRGEALQQALAADSLLLPTRQPRGGARHKGEPGIRPHRQRVC